MQQRDSQADASSYVDAVRTSRLFVLWYLNVGEEGESAKRMNGCNETQKNQTRLSPGAHQRHAERAQNHQEVGADAAAAPEHLPALVGEEILRQQLDQRGEDQQARRYRVHDANEDEPHLGRRVVGRVGG
jgi:hypothetical protein